MKCLQNLRVPGPIAVRSGSLQHGQDQWESLQRLVENGPAAGQAEYDAEAEARAAVAELVAEGADVVLTTYAVLQQEVHYSAAGEDAPRLRHAKRYRVPDSPLISVRCCNAVP